MVGLARSVVRNHGLFKFQAVVGGQDRIKTGIQDLPDQGRLLIGNRQLLKRRRQGVHAGLHPILCGHNHLLRERQIPERVPRLGVPAGEHEVMGFAPRRSEDTVCVGFPLCLSEGTVQPIPYQKNLRPYPVGDLW